MPGQTSNDRTDSINIPWSEAVRFIRQLSHDLRNHLNVIELQSAYIAELAEGAELQSEIKRLREMISVMAATLQKLSSGLESVRANPISYRAADFVEDLRRRIEREFPDKSNEIIWDVQPDDAMVHIDPELLQQAFIELFANAFEHGRSEGALVLTAKIDPDRFVLSLREPKTHFGKPTENWGREPLQNISRRHYGLGLNRVRAIVEANCGEMRAEYDPKASTLTTMLSFSASSGSRESG